MSVYKGKNRPTFYTPSITKHIKELYKMRKPQPVTIGDVLAVVIVASWFAYYVYTAIFGNPSGYFM